MIQILLLFSLTIFAAFAFGQSGDSKLLPEVPEGAQAVSVTGTPLYAADPSEGALENHKTAKADYDADPMDVDNIIWYGRRTAYLGDYREAIRIFSEGIEKHPKDARMYRHRGHRYISIREFDRAIADLEKAASLIEGTENETEPDGLPNAQGIPISSLHGNIWYHLGLAYYLKHDWENAFRSYQNGFNAGRNDDNRVSTTHWLYSIARRMGDEARANKALEAIATEMNIIENFSYHRLCLFYKGEIPLEEILADGGDNPENAAVAYGVANWFFVEGESARAWEMMQDLTSRSSWSAFGQVAAEVDLSSR